LIIKSAPTILTIALLAVVASPASAQDYPSRPVEVVVPFPAGGGTDILTRLLAQELQDKLGKPVIVDNRVGAGTQIAANATAKSAPDGYTIFLAPVTTLAIGPNIFKSLPYDTVKDFAPIGLVGSAQFALVANPNLNAPTLPDLIKLIKSKNGQMSYGTSGASTPHHLFMEMFLKMIGASAQHVPYRGSAPALTDVIAGRVPLMFDIWHSARRYVDSGDLKLIAGAGPDPLPGAESVPVIDKTYPGFSVVAFNAVIAPAGTPAAVLERLSADLRAVVTSPAFAGRTRALGINAWGNTPKDLDAWFASETAKWAEIAKAANLKAE